MVFTTLQMKVLKKHFYPKTKGKDGKFLSWRLGDLTCWYLAYKVEYYQYRRFDSRRRQVPRRLNCCWLNITLNVNIFLTELLSRKFSKNMKTSSNKTISQISNGHILRLSSLIGSGLFWRVLKNNNLIYFIKTHYSKMTDQRRHLISSL